LLQRLRIEGTTLALLRCLSRHQVLLTHFITPPAPPIQAIIGDEPYVSYERPALSKAYLFPEAPARLPGFHSCVGGGGERQLPEFYAQHGIDYLTNTKVTAVDVATKQLTTASGDSITYDKLVVATGARVRLEGSCGLVGKHAGLAYSRWGQLHSKLATEAGHCAQYSASHKPAQQSFPWDHPFCSLPRWSILRRPAPTLRACTTCATWRTPMR
jgi:NADPH-dependent 2,4-dienoyl-CoA reductase/sulfur reductase-like enzyme